MKFGHLGHATEGRNTNMLAPLSLSLSLSGYTLDGAKCFSIRSEK